MVAFKDVGEAEEASFMAGVMLISFSEGVSSLLAFFLVSMIPTSSLIPWAF